MDPEIFGKLKRGKLHPEGRLDLQAMTLIRAHSPSDGFVDERPRTGQTPFLVVPAGQAQRG